MRLFVLAFIPATLWLQHAEWLPDPRPGVSVLAVLLALRLARGRRVARAVLLLAAGALAGYFGAAWRAQERLADELPQAWEGRDVELTGVVAGLAQVRSRGTRFLFAVEDVTTPGAVVPRRVSLTWYPQETRAGRIEPALLVPGTRWRLTARMKRPRGLSNPHGFDFEPWALERGIRATGYVRTASVQPVPAGNADGWPHLLHRWRSEVREAMLARLDGSRLRGVLVALAIGDQDAIAPADWDVFWRTGVGHLMSISGLHITMLAGLAFAAAFFAWARIPALALRLPARKAAVVAGTLVALAYTLMTGYAIPAQRTFTMLAAIALCVLADRHGSASRVLAFAALVVLALDPWAVLAAGFWLSFGAVAAIFYAMALRTRREGPRRRAQQAMRSALREQLAVTVVMLPLVLALFHEVSLVSPLANLAAIPVVSLVVVPLAIAGAFLGWGWALALAHAVLEALMSWLERMAAWPVAMVEGHAPAGWAVAAALVGCAWLLAPRGVPLRALGVAWLLPLFAVVPARPAWGEAWLDVLDVGNGLAVVVRTATRTLAYDAGPSWGDESDSGDRIVVPFLRGEGVARLDALLVSHADDDHAGGAISVAALRQPAWLLSSLDPGDALHSLVARSFACEAGQRWSWDGVEFAVLHPRGHDPARESNDSSCVLRIATRGASALLTGDIEARSEAELLLRERAGLAADLLLVPHHGSRTSSTAAFVAAVAPRAGILSVGHRNRYRHPNGAVMARYAALGIRMHRTDQVGALQGVLPGESSRAATVQAHARRVRYWSDRRLP